MQDLKALLPGPIRWLSPAFANVLGANQVIQYLRNQDASSDENYLNTVLRRMCIRPAVNIDAPSSIPRNGVLIFVANHPCGIIDGLVALSAIIPIRPDIKAIANELTLRIAPATVKSFLIMVNRSVREDCGTPNAGSMKEVMGHLQSSRALLIFPAGRVASCIRNGTVEDDPWDPLVGHLVQKYRTPVTPVFLGGRNSHLFYLARRLHSRLGSLLLLRELLNKAGTTIDLRMGSTIPYRELELSTSRDITELLRTKTRQLGERL